jgi:hypothetical protein
LRAIPVDHPFRTRIRTQIRHRQIDPVQRNQGLSATIRFLKRPVIMVRGGCANRLTTRHLENSPGVPRPPVTQWRSALERQTKKSESLGYPSPLSA